MNRSGDRGVLSPGWARKLRLAGIAALPVVVLLQLAIPIEGQFGPDDLFGFAALYGFLSTVLLVLAARLFGKLLKRPDYYYDA